MTALFPALQDIKTPVSFKGMTHGFPVLYMLLLTELTTQIVVPFCQELSTHRSQTCGIRGFSTLEIRHLNSIHGLTERFWGRVTESSY